jgi:hypothetical protein
MSNQPKSGQVFIILDKNTNEVLYSRSRCKYNAEEFLNWKGIDKNTVNILNKEDIDKASFPKDVRHSRLKYDKNNKKFKDKRKKEFIYNFNEKIVVKGKEIITKSRSYKFDEELDNTDIQKIENSIGLTLSSVYEKRKGDSSRKNYKNISDKYDKEKI